MSWKVVDRTTVAPDELGPGISEATKTKIRSFFSRYPTKQAALLPALHIAQDEIGYCSLRAMREIAELLEISPSQVLDVVTFYTHFWTHPKGKKVIVLCRSISCELMGGKEVREAIEKKLGIEDHGTTADGQYSLLMEECLAGCDHAPCLLINEKMHKCVKPEQIDAILADAKNDQLSIPRSETYDAPRK